jgi:hypothetical protein
MPPALPWHRPGSVSTGVEELTGIGAPVQRSETDSTKSTLKA